MIKWLLILRVYLKVCSTVYFSLSKKRQETRRGLNVEYNNLDRNFYEEKIENEAYDYFASAVVGTSVQDNLHFLRSLVRASRDFALKRGTLYLNSFVVRHFIMF